MPNLPATYRPDMGTFIVPLADREELANIGDKAQKKLDLRLRCMAAVCAATNKKAEYASLASRLGSMKGFSAVQIKRAWLAFKAAEYDWRVLVDEYHRPDKKVGRGHPPAFVTYWCGLALSYQRNGTAQAYQELKRLWKLGESIPGFGTWREWYQTRYPGRATPAICPRLPDGWSENNLRQYLPSEVEISIIRDGYAASHAGLPQMARDRSGLRPLEVLAFDDVQADFRVLSLAANQVCKLRGLFAQCVGSAVIAEHFTGAVLSDDEERERGIVKDDMRLLIYTILRKYGIPRDWTMHLLVENATATISDADEKFLKQLSDGRIVVIRTAMHERDALPGFVAERWGSPWQKGSLESFFNLLHNALSATQGQAGKNPITDKTGYIDALAKDVRALALATDGLPADLRQALIFGLLREDKAQSFVREMVHRLNLRDNHSLQGFEKIPLWRLHEADAPRPIEELPPALRDHVKLEWVMESPLARMTRMVKGAKFDVPSDAALAPLLNDKVKVKVKRPYQIEFTWRGEKRTFFKQDERLRKEGTPFIGLFDPRDFTYLHLHDEAMAYVTTAPLQALVPWLDHDAIHAEQKRIMAARESLIGTAHATQAAKIRENADRQEANNAVIADGILRMRDGETPFDAAEAAAQAALSQQTAITQRAAKVSKSAAKKRDSINSQLAELSRSAGQQE
jgi:hypothetical protein